MSALIVSLLVAGFIMLIAELFVPGMIVGTFGAIAVAGGVVLSYREFGFEIGSGILLASCIAGFLMFLWWLHYFPRSFVGRRLTLSASVKGPTDHPDFRALIGEEGKALTHLRPAGVAEFADQRVDVVAESGYVATGAALRVIATEGARVIVREL